jgi:HPt (histidine-containing phosphotransfer) domain-containing protein
MEKTNSADFYLVDLHYLKEVTEDSPASMLEIINVFVEVVPLELEHIRCLIEKQAFIEFKVAVHKLKPKYHYVGVTALDAYLAQLEEKIQGREWTTCLAIFEEAAYTTNAVILELHQVKDTLHRSLQIFV